MKSTTMSRRDLNRLLDAMFCAGVQWRASRPHGIRTSDALMERMARDVRKRMFAKLKLTAVSPPVPPPSVESRSGRQP